MTALVRLFPTFVVHTMSSLPPEKPVVKGSRPRSYGRWLLVLISVAVLAWTLPRPALQDVVIGHTEHDGSQASSEVTGRLAFRSARRLSELATKGPLADETELSGPCLADDGKLLYFARSRPGQRADIMLARRDGERFTRAEPVRELNSVDDDRRVTIDAKGQSLLLASNRSGTRGGFDLYESSQVREHWSKPKNVGESLNSEADEFDPSLSGDGLTLYFVRRATGETADIFESHRQSIDATWSAPQAVTAVNSAESHERSPAISPDGKFLYFASNRVARSGDASQFDLFRASLQGGVVGTPIRVRDGIESAADDVDAAFAGDGRTLVFASKREGPKQLYLSNADFVATRLTWSTEHLAPFGRAKWGAPILSGLFFLWVLGRTRRSIALAVVAIPQETKLSPPKIANAEKPMPPKRNVEAAVVPERRVETIDQPKQRSKASKNPLADWPTGLSSSTPTVSPSKSIEPTKKDRTQTSEPTATPAVAESPSASSSAAEQWTVRRIFKTTVAVVLVAVCLIAFKSSWPIPKGTSSFDDETLTNLVQFRDIASSRQAEQKPIARVTTARIMVPTTSSESMDLTGLQKAARWPSTLVAVRSKAAVDRVAEELPDLARMSKQLVVMRQAIAGVPLYPRETVADEANLLGGSIAPEKVVGSLGASLSKQIVVLSPQQRALLQPAVVTSSTLRLPQMQAKQVAAAVIAAELKAISISAMPRNGVPSRANAVVEIVPSELSLPLSVVAVSEQAISPKLLAVNRGVVNEASLPPVLGPVTVKQTAAISNVVARPTVVVDAVRDLAEVGVIKESKTASIARKTVETKLGPIIVEPVTQSSSTASSGGPALLLTSATQLVELLPPSTLAATAKFQTLGPTPIIGVATDSASSKWQSRITASRINIEPRDLRVESTAPTVGQVTTLPRQTKESIAVGIVEEVKPIDP